MCGIFGIFSSTNNENYYQKINNKEFLKHRGPDNQSTYFDKNIFLYHSRLAIIDEGNKNSNQPMQDNSGRWKIIFNGEIYNYLEIKDKLCKNYNFVTNSDTEVLLASFIIDGPQSLNRIRGMFSAVIFDSLKKKIFLFRDRYGIKPLIYTISNKKIFFSSELNAFKKIDINMNLNNKSLIDVFKYGSVNMKKLFIKNFTRLSQVISMNIA
jgi:asparagine synthase (glutamine-hydrolysing)